MKLRFAFLGLLSLIAVSCSYEESFVLEDNNDNSAVEFYATIDEQPDADTRVYADENLRVLWNADDRITIFNKNTYNQQYRFTGENGDNAGGFRIVKSDDEFITSNPLDNIYAVYPYRETNKISNSGVVTTSIPSEQTYKANSFGIGANTMVSVAESNMLKFKNVGGYLSLKFYGEGVSVSSITLKSNNGELIAGDCSIDMSSGLPSSTMAYGRAVDEITLVCDTPVKLGTSTSESTEFCFVLYPVTLSKGFTITLNASDGSVFQKSSSLERVIGRSSIVRMGAIEVKAHPPVAGVALNKTELYLSEGLSETLEAILYPDGAIGSVTWRSSDDSIAMVDKTGKVIALKEGTAVITATANGYSATCLITVIAVTGGESEGSSIVVI